MDTRPKGDPGSLLIPLAVDQAGKALKELRDSIAHRRSADEVAQKASEKFQYAHDKVQELSDLTAEQDKLL